MQVRFLFSEDTEFSVEGRSKIADLNWAMEFDLYLQHLALTQEASPTTIKDLLCLWDNNVFAAHYQANDGSAAHGKGKNRAAYLQKEEDDEDLSADLIAAERVELMRAFEREAEALERQRQTANTFSPQGSPGPACTTGHLDPPESMPPPPSPTVTPTPSPIPAHVTLTDDLDESALQYVEEVATETTREEEGLASAHVSALMADGMGPQPIRRSGRGAKAHERGAGNDEGRVGISTVNDMGPVVRGRGRARGRRGNGGV